MTDTTIWIEWRKADCVIDTQYKIQLKENDGVWVDVYEGHPGGYFSQDIGDNLHVSLNNPPGSPGDASATVRMLHDGSLYFEITRPGRYAVESAPPASLNISSVPQQHRDSMVLPDLETELDSEGKLSGITWRCKGSEPSDQTKFIQAPGCARTVSFAKFGKFEYMQGGLGSGKNYSFRVTACDESSCRDWSDEVKATTMPYTTVETSSSNMDTVDPCGPAGLTLDKPTGTISQRLRRSPTSAECIWRIGSSAQVDSLVYFHFEPYDSSGDETRAMVVGRNFFYPITSADVAITVQTGLSRVIVVNGGENCGNDFGLDATETMIDVKISPANGAAATAFLDRGKIIYINVTKSGSGFTSLPVLKVKNCVDSVLVAKVSSIMEDCR